MVVSIHRRPLVKAGTDQFSVDANLIRLYLFLFASIVLAVSSEGQINNTSGALENVTLQLKWKHQFQFAGYYAAIEKGFYAAAGLKVTLRELGTNQDPVDVVASDHAEYGIAMSDLVLAFASHEPVVVLAPIYQHSPLVLLVLASSGIRNVHQLKGKRICLDPHEAELIAHFDAE